MEEDWWLLLAAPGDAVLPVTAAVAESVGLSGPPATRSSVKRAVTPPPFLLATRLSVEALLPAAGAGLPVLLAAADEDDDVDDDDDSFSLTAAIPSLIVPAMLPATSTTIEAVFTVVL